MVKSNRRVQSKTGEMSDEHKNAISLSKQMFTPDVVIEALERNNGWLTKTAKDLNCSTRTLNRYIATYPEIKERYDDFVERQGEGVEKKLQDLIEDGNVQAVMFYLRTKWRHKGYTEKIALDIVPFPMQQELLALCEARGLSIVDILTHMIDEIKNVPLLEGVTITVEGESVE